MDLNGRSEDEKWARFEMVAALPGIINVGAMVHAVVQDALADVLHGRRKQSCLHSWTRQTATAPALGR
jgi:hypothetical protein